MTQKKCLLYNDCLDVVKIQPTILQSELKSLTCILALANILAVSIVDIKLKSSNESHQFHSILSLNMKLGRAQL